MEEEVKVGTEDIEEQDAVRAAVMSAKSFRAKLEATGLSYAEFLLLEDASRELGDIAHDFLSGWERGECWPMEVSFQDESGKEAGMNRPKVTKTSLYKLVREFEELPSMRRTEFKKAYRSTDYWLTWEDNSGLRCEAFLIAGRGAALLAIEKRAFDGPRISRVVHKIGTKALLERGMVEKSAEAEERRRAKGGADCGAV